MAYVDPNDVTSPQAHWQIRKVLYDGGEGSWSVAAGLWKDNQDDEEGYPVLAICWNGTESKESGYPVVRGYPTWFIVPEALQPHIYQTAVRLSLIQKAARQ